MTNRLSALVLGLAVAGCFSQSQTAIDACKVAFRSSNTVDVKKFDQTRSYTFDRKDTIVVNFSYIDDNVHNSPMQAECEIVAPIESGDLPELLRMHINGNFFSQDKVVAAQSAIIKWAEKRQ